MMSAKSLTLLAGLAAISFAGVANADTETFTSATVGPYNTDFGTGAANQSRPVVNLSLPTFDTSLGTLNSISFTVGGSVTTIFAGQDLSGNANSVTLTSSANIALYAPPVATAANLIAFVIPSNALPPIPIAPNSSFGPQTVVASGTSGTASYGGSFLPFETLGSGSIVLPVSANGQSAAADTNGNILASIRTTATAFGTVTYNYTVPTTGVPEPGSVAMLVAGGMTGAGFFVRRRRK